METGAAAQAATNRHQETVQTYCVLSQRPRKDGWSCVGRIEPAARGSPQPPQKDVESFVASDQLIQHRAEGEGVGSMIERAALHLFRRHIGHGAEDCAGRGSRQIHI